MFGLKLNVIPADNPLFNLWENIEVFATKGLKPPIKYPLVLPTGLEYIDKFVELKTPKGKGIPGGTWMLLAGTPGSGKTTLGLQIVQALCRSGKAEGVHFDYELGPTRTAELYDRLGVTDVEYMYEYDRANIVAALAEQAKLKAETDTMVIALIDSFEFLSGGSNNFETQRAVAQELRELREAHKNLLLITVNHLTKSGQVQGAAEVQKYSDIRFLLQKNDKNVYLSAPKNRDTAADAPASMKLKLTHRGFEIDKTPDFITESPLLSGLLNFAKGKKKS